MISLQSKRKKPTCFLPYMKFLLNAQIKPLGDFYAMLPQNFSFSAKFKWYICMPDKISPQGMKNYKVLLPDIIATK